MSRVPTSQPNRLARLAEALQRADYAQAASLCRTLIRDTPDDPRLHHNLGYALGEIGDFEQATTHARRAVELAPARPHFRQGLASLLVRLDRLEEAIALCEEGLTPTQRDATLVGYLAELHVLAHRFEEARRLVEPQLDGDPPEPFIVLAWARLAPRIDAVDDAIERLRALESHGATQEQFRTRARFRLGSLLDRRARYDEAFVFFEQANAPVARTYSPESASASFDQLLHMWRALVYSKLPGSGIDTERPVFIVSVPRSGSTLVEQIIAAHPASGAMGEWTGIPNAAETLRRRQGRGMLDPSRLKPAHLVEAARGWLDGANRRYPEASRVTDKMLTNFQHIGLISLLFPRARIIECLRHPYDTALSAFFQDFTSGNPWASSLRGMALFRRDFDRVMAHWKSIVPNPILTVRYESLVADQECETRRIIDFLGLPWHDACLDFHRAERIAVTASNQQVSRRLYDTSVGRWRHYAAHLAPLREILGDPEAAT